MNIIVNEDGSLSYATGALAQVHNMLQQMQLSLGQDLFYANSGIDWLFVTHNGQNPLPYLQGISSKYTQFITEFTSETQAGDTIYYTGVINITVRSLAGEILATATIGGN